MQSFLPTLSVKMELSSVAQQFTIPENGTVRLFADRKFHLCVDQEADELLVDDHSMPIGVEQPFFLAGTSKGSLISFFVVDGETDGTLWVTIGARG